MSLSGTKEAVVQFGIMKMKVNLSDLEFLASAPDAPPPALRRATTVKRTRDENIRNELDLRGANLEEAIMETDRFIDEAFLGNLGQISIIHGKGTGSCGQEYRNTSASTSMSKAIGSGTIMKAARV